MVFWKNTTNGQSIFFLIFNFLNSGSVLALGVCESFPVGNRTNSRGIRWSGKQKERKGCAKAWEGRLLVGQDAAGLAPRKTRCQAGQQSRAAAGSHGA